MANDKFKPIAPAGVALERLAKRGFGLTQQDIDEANDPNGETQKELAELRRRAKEARDSGDS